MPESLPRVLICEDNVGSRRMLSRRLAAVGYEVFAVDDGIACLDWLQHRRCDLVLMDVGLPRMDGIACVREIRRHFSPDSLPVILVSGFAESADVVAGLDAGANDYVLKPICLKILRARIRTCLRIRNAVSTLVEAERQRVMIETLGRSAARLSMPIAQMVEHLEAFARQRLLLNPETSRDMENVLRWIESVTDVIELLQAVGRDANVPYLERLGELERITSANSAGPDAA